MNNHKTLRQHVEKNVINSKIEAKHDLNLIIADPKKKISTVVIIPGYDQWGNSQNINLKITINPSDIKPYFCKDIVTKALERNFQRIISIMSSLKKGWRSLKYCSYQLECDRPDLIVKDARSSSMALSIGLLNIYRELNSKHQIANITGTGILRIDGSFERAYLEQQKKIAVKNSDGGQKVFITSNKCSHLFDLENLLEQIELQEK